MSRLEAPASWPIASLIKLIKYLISGTITRVSAHDYTVCSKCFQRNLSCHSFLHLMDEENVIFYANNSEFLLVNIVFLAGSRTPKRINTNTGGQRVTGNIVYL